MQVIKSKAEQSADLAAMCAGRTVRRMEQGRRGYSERELETLTEGTDRQRQELEWDKEDKYLDATVFVRRHTRVAQMEMHIAELNARTRAKKRYPAARKAG